MNDGAKSDTGNIGDILRHDNSMGVTDPIYPVYIDSNVMCGRAGVLEGNGQWSNVTYLPCTAENDFIPEIPDKRIDIVYLCYPNNPTGTTLTKTELKKWVDYALDNDTLILFDAAYEAYIREDDVPHSIYEIKGAKKCSHRVPQLLENCRIHRSALRLHRCTQGTHCRHAGRRTHPAEQARGTAANAPSSTAPATSPNARRKPSTRRKAKADKGNDPLLYDNARTMKQGLEAPG